MCTDHQRNGHHHHPPKPTITRVPLARITQPSRWSRRRLLVSGGLGTASMAILAACGSEAASTAATTTTTTQAEAAPNDSETPTTADQEAPQEESAPAQDAGDATGELQLQHVSLGFVSAYVLVRGNEAAIVDTGTSGSGDAINEALTDLGLGPSNVRHIVLTHNHGDHVGGLGKPYCTLRLVR